MSQFLCDYYTFLPKPQILQAMAHHFSVVFQMFLLQILSDLYLHLRLIKTLWLVILELHLLKLTSHPLLYYIQFVQNLLYQGPRGYFLYLKADIIKILFHPLALDYIVQIDVHGILKLMDHGSHQEKHETFQNDLPIHHLLIYGGNSFRSSIISKSQFMIGKFCRYG